jgi:acyl carrier protein
VKEKDIQLEVEMSEYGFNSLTLTDFANRINKSYKLTITPALFFECPTLGSLAEYLYNVHGDVFADIYGDSPAKAEIVNEDWDGQEIKVSLDEFNIKSRFPVKPSGKVLLGTGVKAEPEPVAIIGISGIMPGSDNLEEFWENIENGQDLITEIPKDRWDWRALDASQGRSISRWGGFMNEVDKFDSMFFKLSPREAQRMDPQQRLFLETVWKTVEDAGYRASDLYGTRTGLFVGVATNDYYDLTKDYGLEIESYSSMGVSHCILANRISYIMNWHGPSVPIDTACSSSLIAVHQALESIKNGDCDMAVAGGINVIASPTLHISFSKAGMLSPDGRCKTFDKRANGYVRGEGSGAILLKPLSKAEADGDHIIRCNQRKRS